MPLTARAEAERFAFAVVANALAQPDNEADAQRLIDAIGRNDNVSFIVYDGNLKGPHEPCSDALYERRHALLEASRPALVFVPGQQDWVTCGSAGTGNYDPVERLDLLRQTLFSTAHSMGQNPLALTRESEVSRFRPYRENVRWQLGNTVFVALNVPDGNNHYLIAGGRNGEFEDRVVANGFWLEHAAEYAKRRNARALVIFMQADPVQERAERPERFDWLRFGRRQPRDGYAETRRYLVKLAETFRGPVILVHAAEGRLAHGFLIDQPLRNDKGIRIANVTRVAFSLRDPLTQWLQIDADMTRQPPLRVGVHDVPKNLPMLPPPQPASEAPDMPAMPEISSMPDVTTVPDTPPGASAPDLGNTPPATPPANAPAPLPQAPGQPQPPLQP